MGFGVAAEAAVGGSRVASDEPAAGPTIAPGAIEFAASSAGDPRHCPEIDCLRALLSADVLAAAAARADRVGVGADRVLIASGAVSEETYLRALGDSLGVAFEPLDGIARDQCPMADERLIESAAAGMVPLTAGDELCLVVAPRGVAARRMLHLIEEEPAFARCFRFTSAERFNRFVLRYGGKAIATQAASELERKWPMFSAAPPRWRGRAVPAALVIVTLAALIAAPDATLTIVELMLAAMFLAWLALRLTGVFIGTATEDSPARTADDELPVYTIVSALYREAASVDGLLSAVERLDYPGIMAQTPQDIFRWPLILVACPKYVRSQRCASSATRSPPPSGSMSAS